MTLRFRQLIAAVAALFVAGCAGGMSAAECSGADWAALGAADGAAGARPKLFEQRAKACADHGLAVDVAAYEAGRERGLAQYCTDAGGFAAGKSGGEYLGVCPAATEGSFRTGFNAGAKLFLLTAAREKAVADYEKAVVDLDQHRYLLTVAEKRRQKSSISNEDREHERQEAEFRSREIIRIENDLPKLLDAIETSRTALDAYKAELSASGRTF